MAKKVWRAHASGERRWSEYTVRRAELCVVWQQLRVLKSLKKKLEAAMAIDGYPQRN